MTLDLFQVDAFTDQLFKGNPAAVVPLEEWLDDRLLQAIAMENQLSETAFFVPSGDAFELRWFTPVAEVDLCGHATLATAHVLFKHLYYSGTSVMFHTRYSGTLTVRNTDSGMEMELPAWSSKSCEPSKDLIQGLGQVPKTVRKARDYLTVFPSEHDIRSLEPDFEALSRVDALGVIATAPGESCDFVSRFFAPKEGIPEDPVTGSAHSILVPFWAEQTGKTEFFARQLSARGGSLQCRLFGDRVFITGNAVLYLRGTIEISE